MAQNKMERDFSDKLNQRQITASSQGWDRLDAMLTVAEEKKQAPKYHWIYIAASLGGFLLIGTIFFSQTEEMCDVKRQDIVIENQSAADIAPKVASANEIPAVSKKATSFVEATHSAPEATHKPNVTLNQVSGSSKNAAVAESTIINQKTELRNEIPKANELFAAQAPNTPTDTALPSIKVDAKSLLSAVEGEVNLSFREKMLLKVNKNYLEVAEAVTNRNLKQ